VLVSSHVLAGVVIGRLVARRPAAAFGAGLVSHFLMDACPHWGTGDRPGEWSDDFLRVARCDGCAGLAAMAIAAGVAPGHSRRAVLAGMAGAALPDLDKPCEYLFGVNPFPGPVRRFHQRIQREAPDRLPAELVAAAALAVAAAVALARS
jgi:hypothetical protein